MEKNTFQLSKKQLEIILNNGKKSAEDSKLIIKGTEEVMSMFELKLNESENLDFDLKLTLKNGLIYLKQQRPTTPHFTIDSY